MNIARSIAVILDGSGGGVTPPNLGIVLDGVDDYGYLSAPQNLGTAHTLSFWAKSADTSWGATGNSGADYMFFYVSGNIYCTLNGGATAAWAYLQTADWTHYLITRNGTSATLYVNDVLVGTSTCDGGVCTWQLFGSFGAFAGSLKDLRIYNVVKSSPERAAIFAGTIDLVDCVSHWPMDEGVDSIASTNLVFAGPTLNWSR